MVFRTHIVQGRSMELMFTCFFFALFISNFFSGRRCNGSDTILIGQSLFPNQTIISKGGKFELGFFSPGSSSNVYVGIWYKNIPEKTVVWVLNRQNPIRYSLYDNTRLEMLNGSLYLYADVGAVWAEREIFSDATEAVILDNGNFVLRNASGNIVWQSFDYPTETWLPGGKIGFRWFTDIETKLVSWRSSNDPAFGNYSLGMDRDGGTELFIASVSGSVKLWRSGPWQGGTFASLSDNSNFNNFTYVSRDGNVYLTYNVYNESIISRIVIDSLGGIKNYVWSEAIQEWTVRLAQPSDACKSYNFCGPNAVCDSSFLPICGCLDGFVPRSALEWARADFSGGCQRRPLECAEGKTEFMKGSNYRLPAGPKSLEVELRICKLVCSDNCSCNAFASDGRGGCLLFIGDLLDLERLPNNSSGGDLYIRMASVERPGNGKRNVFPVALVLLITAPLLVSCFCVCYQWRKQKGKDSSGEHQNLLLLDLNSNGSEYDKHTSVRNSHGEHKNNQYELPIFSFSSIAASTNNFSVTKKLGEGGFGPVYKGELLSGQFVAVKRLSTRSGQGLEEFRNETELIAKLQHRNLVGVLGCCIENDEKILVYEYMPNKSLDSFIFEPTKREVLDWKKRAHIIEGIAQGLLYLHHYSRLKIVHRDLKASNILLDADLKPKISDFGMARIFGGNDTSQANTKRIVGTYGYMSPEYAMEGRFSVKSDVFAFGVLMLEIISGKKNTGFYGSDYLSLLGYAWNMWKHERVLQLIDPILEVSASSSSIPLRYIQIGLLCVEENPADRPLMSEVVGMLNNEESVIASPQQPAFTLQRTLAKANLTQNKVEICSVNGLTISHVEAR